MCKEVAAGLSGVGGGGTHGVAHREKQKGTDGGKGGDNVQPKVRECAISPFPSPCTALPRAWMGQEGRRDVDPGGFGFPCHLART